MAQDGGAPPTLSIGKTVAMGLGIGLVGMQVSRMLGYGGKRGGGGGGIPSVRCSKALTSLHAGDEISQDLLALIPFPDLLSEFPAAGVALCTNTSLLSLCERIHEYRQFDRANFAALVLAASAFSLLSFELAAGWKVWSLATPRHFHGLTFEMLMAARRIRQTLARSGLADYLVDFDELAAEVSQLHSDTSLNSLLESRHRAEASKPKGRQAART